MKIISMITLAFGLIWFAGFILGTIAFNVDHSNILWVETIPVIIMLIGGIPFIVSFIILLSAMVEEMYGGLFK